MAQLNPNLDTLRMSELNDGSPSFGLFIIPNSYIFRRQSTVRRHSVHIGETPILLDSVNPGVISNGWKSFGVSAVSSLAWPTLALLPLLTGKKKSTSLEV
ncbi:hypothetical protein WICPIJ_006160 [Wickerhamomyces pijperi]|uniref:Uncharacterized protein n=1 Tax=Wickerhamomyces pijperi TaxID=599730 RepID=A0A9P8TKG2_WICPI|nr:hypothetical protein WICPIJ_006160 [Wickerhamomyces pijperi]